MEFEILVDGRLESYATGRQAAEDVAFRLALDLAREEDLTVSEVVDRIQIQAVNTVDLAI